MYNIILFDIRHEERGICNSNEIPNNYEYRSQSDI